MSKVYIGSRGSKLALWQAQWVKQNISRRRPDLDLEIKVIKSEADARHDLAPEAFGQEGIFTVELDRALLDQEIDLCVHSLKDLPTRSSPGLALAAVTERASSADVFVLRSDHAKDLEISARSPAFQALGSLPEGFVVGTSSLRRMAQLKYHFQALEFAPLRGNVDTRMRKLSEGQVDGLALAQAGIERLGIASGAHVFLSLLPDWYLPAAGQGALAIETREDDPARELARGLDHAPTRTAVTAERTAMAALGAGCRVPAGFLAVARGHELVAKGVVGRPDGSVLIKAEVSGPASDPRALGRRLADELYEKGAGAVLKGVRA